ncbi:DUF742 domain-containing protein [Streptomyces sp. NPDC058247]|uniref:DUF742 domain-containing protein n=1 Tax=Streptomyces sp. NPDC058247 TaxID=3346401 RepID=UPI0036E57772
MATAAGRGHTRRGVVRSHTVLAAQLLPPGGTVIPVDMATLLSVNPDAGHEGLSTPALRLLALCAPGVLSVADVSAHLHMPGGVTRALVADLVGRHILLAADPYVPLAQTHDVEFLERLLHGLHRL